jgi:acyl-CoA thioesterase-2
VRFAERDLRSILELEPAGRDRFRAHSPAEGRRRIFGGQVAAQALLAAARTVEADHRPQSLHAYFLAGGDESVPIELAVERVRSGRSFTVRRVVAAQAGTEILHLAASFHAAEHGGDFAAPMPAGVPAPGGLEPTRFSGPIIETRDVPDPAGAGTGGGGAVEGAGSGRRRLWFRVPAALPALDDDPALHAAAITYATDHGPFGAARRVVDAQGGDFEASQRASLDHALWFHRPAPADDWLLYDIEVVAHHGARILTRAGLYTASGARIGSVSQEILVRTAR